VQRARETLVRLLRAGAVATLVCSLLAFLPADHFAVQLFSHFRLQYLGAALLFLIVFAILQERNFAIISLVALLANAGIVVPWYDGGAQAASGDTRVKLVMANVLSRNDEYERLFDLVDAEQPDVLVVLEVSPAWETALARLEASYPYRVVEARPGNFGIALMSRLPLASSAVIASEPLGFPTIVASLDASGTDLGIVATHPMIPLGPNNYEARNVHLSELADLLQGMSGARLLAGDLNASMWDRSYRLLENRARLTNARQGHGIAPTWPTFLPIAMIPIDHVLVSEEVGVEAVRTGPGIGSDHLPLIVTITL
jgi:endonuclease/exonuclease/phosphatase (EEP) superfamily protein YafD